MSSIVARLGNLSFTNPEDIMFLLGSMVFAKVSVLWIVMVLKNLYVHLLRGRKKLTNYGEWAVVTGASDGIGKAYAIELAKSRLNVVLVARRTAELEKLAKELEETSGVKTKCITADLCQPEAFDNIAKEIAGLDIGVLVNNAGLSYEYPDWIVDVPDWRLQAIIDLNITALTKMCKMVIPGMAERKRGCVVNISSASGTAPTGLLSVYGASKTYVDFFSEGLSQEYAATGIDVQSIIPYFVSTEMSKQRPAFHCPTTKVYAKAAVDAMGYERHTEAFWVHRLIAHIAFSMLPRDWFLGKLFGFHKDIRRRAIRKKERKAAEAAKNL